MSPEIRSKRRSNKRSWNLIHIQTKDQSDSGVWIKAASVHGGTQTGYWAKIGSISVPPWPYLTPAHGFVPNVTLSACQWNFKATKAHFLLSFFEACCYTCTGLHQWTQSTPKLLVRYHYWKEISSWSVFVDLKWWSTEKPASLNHLCFKKISWVPDI